ncbi:hypothetical protein [Streptomyces sparsus]
MHCDIHALTARHRAAELHAAAAAHERASALTHRVRRRPEVLAAARRRVGWALVGTGLRLVQAERLPVGAGY